MAALRSLLDSSLGFLLLFFFYILASFSVWISAGVSMLEIINYLAKIARFLDPTPR